MKKNDLYLFILPLLLSSCASKKIDIYKYNAQSKYWVYGLDSFYYETYIVRNFKHNKKSELKIDSFACNRMVFLKDSIKVKFEINFLKESKFTNFLYLQSHPNFFYQGDWLEQLPSSEKQDFLWYYSIKKNLIIKCLATSPHLNQDIKNFYFPILNCESK